MLARAAAIAHHCATMTVVLRHVRLEPELDGDPGLAGAVAAALRRGLPAGCTVGDGPRIALRRRGDGGWSLLAGAGEVLLDDLAAGAAAARHLAALGARELRYAGPATDGLRLRGFAIAAGALGCSVGRLGATATGGLAGVFADGAAAETAAIAQLAAAGLAVPRDVLLLGIEDGALPVPRAPGLSRLRFDPERIARAAYALAAQPAPGRVLVAPAGVVTRASSDDGAGEDPHLAAALAHLRANLHRPLDVTALARAAGMPRRSLERLFRAALGRSPLDEIRRQRVRRAQELLAHSDLPLAQIAERVGISGADRLGVVFRAVAGATPGAWRRQHRTG
jgi:AraC-like DNA-binding protein